MKRQIFAAVSAIATILSTGSIALAEGKVLYKPYPVDVNRFDAALDRHEASGGFDNIYIRGDGYPAYKEPCQDPYKDVKVEDRTLVILISPCLADRVMHESQLDSTFSSENNKYSSAAAGLMYSLINIFRENQNNREDRYVIVFKIRSSSGGLVGYTFSNGKFAGAPISKAYVSKIK